MPTVATAMTSDSNTPRRGLLDSPYPLANDFRMGNTRSAASDCRIRGAPRNDASAEESVAAKTPASNSRGVTDSSRIA